jgi:hypothetical protein
VRINAVSCSSASVAQRKSARFVELGANHVWHIAGGGKLGYFIEHRQIWRTSVLSSALTCTRIGSQISSTRPSPPCG